MDTPNTPPPNTPPTPPQDPIPTPPGNMDDRQWKVILHLSGLCGLIIPYVGNILGPLVVWLMKKEEMPALEPEGRKVLNFQISWSIYIFLASLSLFFCVGAFLLPVVGLAWLVLLIIGAVKASNGEPYTFPLTIKML